MQVDKWFILILVLLIMFSLWAIVVVGDAGASVQDMHQVYFPVVIHRPYDTMVGADCGPFDIWKPWPPCWIDF